MSDFLRNSPRRWDGEPDPVPPSPAPAVSGRGHWWATPAAAASAYVSWPFYLVIAGVFFVVWRRDGWLLSLTAAVLFGLLFVYATGLWLLLRSEPDRYKRHRAFAAWATLLECVTLAGLLASLVYGAVRFPERTSPHPWSVAAVTTAVLAYEYYVVRSWRQWRTWPAWLRFRRHRHR